MSYIGQQPLNNFVTKQSQTFTPDGSTVSFTLNFAVTSGIDIMLVINNVVQEPGAGKAYTASGTTLTMSEAPGASDSMYCIFLGLALQTVNPGDASVGTSKLTDSAVTTAKLDSSLDLSSKTITLASNMKNTPYFYGELAADATLTRATTTKVTGMTNDELDSATAFDGTTFTVPSGQGGKYYIEGIITADYGSVGQDGEQTIAFIYKNGSEIKSTKHQQSSASGQNMREITVPISGLFNLSANDTIELYAYIQDASGSNAILQADNGRTSLMGYKIIE